MYILGINAYHGDAAAAVLKDGVLIAAVEEERFNRIKHCAGFPAESVRYCLSTAGVGIEDVDHVGISRDPSAHLHKKILFAAGRAAKHATGGRRQGGGSRSYEAERTLLEADTLIIGAESKNKPLESETNSNGHDGSNGQNAASVFFLRLKIA